MASLDIRSVDATGKNSTSGALDLNPAVFEAAIRPHLVQAEVRRQLAARRAGTHSTKNRAMVSGGGAKPYRQKGTGRARQGTTRATQFAGGGITFGPVPRNYAHKLNKKTRRAALRSALSWKLVHEQLHVVEALEVDGFSTKRMVEILTGMGVNGKTLLIVLDAPNPTVEASARNLPGVDVIRAEGLNVYDVLRHKNLLLTRDAVAAVEARLVESGKEGQA